MLDNRFPIHLWVDFSFLTFQCLRLDSPSQTLSSLLFHASLSFLCAAAHLCAHADVPCTASSLLALLACPHRAVPGTTAATLACCSLRAWRCRVRSCMASSLAPADAATPPALLGCPRCLPYLALDEEEEAGPLARRPLARRWPDARTRCPGCVARVEPRQRRRPLAPPTLKRHRRPLRHRPCLRAPKRSRGCCAGEKFALNIVNLTFQHFVQI